MVSPPKRVFHKHSQLDFCVRDGNRYFLAIMAVFKKAIKSEFLKFTMEKLSRSESLEKINNFFKTMDKNTPQKDIRKIKKLAMKQNIKLGEKRKKFCKKCYSPKLRTKSLKNKIKTIKCKNCGTIFRWKVK